MTTHKIEGTTLDDLALAVARGFDSVETRLGSIDTRLDSVETKLGAMDARLGAVEVRLELVEGKLVRVEHRVEEVYDIVKYIEESDVADLQKRVYALEKTTKSLTRQIQK